MADQDRRGIVGYRSDTHLPVGSARLAQLLEQTEIQALFESCYSLLKIPIAIIDLDCNILLSSSWQRICREFHRANEVSCAGCIQSDKELISRLSDGESYAVGQCRNGLTDCVTPLCLGGEKIANVFIGQFITGKLDEEFFRRQAVEFGFDEQEYLAAAREVPVVEPERVPLALDMLVNMTRVITKLSEDRDLFARAEERTNAILDTIPLSVFWKDIEGRYVGANAAFLRNCGMTSADQIIGKTDHDLPWSKEQTDGFRADDRELMTLDRPKLHIVESIDVADGRTLVVDTSKVPLLDAVGTPEGVVGVFEDITERKLAEDALHERLHVETLMCDLAAQFLRVDGSDVDSVVAQALQDICLGVGMDIASLWEVAPEEPSGALRLKTFYRRDDDPPVPDMMYMHDYFPWAFEYLSTARQVLTIDDTAALPPEAAVDRQSFQRFGCATNISVPHIGSDGIVVGIMSFHRTTVQSVSPLTVSRLEMFANIVFDLLARARSERSLAMSKEEQRRIQHQLVQAVKLESIGRLAGGMAHDFNNILGAIIGYAELMLEGVHEGDPTHNDLQQIYKAAQRAAALTRQLLAFSRKQVLQLEVINLNSVIEDVHPMLQRLIGEDIELDCDLADDLWYVSADRGQIEQVIVNLVVNARDAMPSGGRLTIGTTNVELDQVQASSRAGLAAGDHVELVVADDGCGMTKDVLDNIFEPFFTTKEQGRGTGLGLSMAYGVIKQSGGDVEVVSEPGVGTTFLHSEALFGGSLCGEGP